MEVDQETVFSPDRHDHSKRINYTQGVWRQNDAQKFRESIIHPQEENVTASGISRGRPRPNAVSRVFAAQANREHAVFLLEVGHWSVSSKLQREVAHACELTVRYTQRRVDCVDLRQILSLCSAGRKHLPCK
jgi:hypothetical protein